MFQRIVLFTILCFIMNAPEKAKASFFKKPQHASIPQGNDINSIVISKLQPFSAQFQKEYGRYLGGIKKALMKTKPQPSREQIQNEIVRAKAIKAESDWYGKIDVVANRIYYDGIAHLLDKKSPEEKTKMVREASTAVKNYLTAFDATKFSEDIFKKLEERANYVYIPGPVVQPPNPYFPGESNNPQPSPGTQQRSNSLGGARVVLKDAPATRRVYSIPPRAPQRSLPAPPRRK